MVDHYADEGLRTLFVAEREIPEYEFLPWFENVKKAKLMTKGRDKALENLNNEIEVGLTLTGSTAIEDRLQDEVADTIRFMKRTGIKVWVLTGDKIGTAKNIGMSAGLLEKGMEQFQIDGKEKDESRNRGSNVVINEQLNYCSQNIGKSGKPTAVIVAGDALLIIKADEDMLKRFTEASIQANVVLACRVSPQQKADIVMMIRGQFPSKVTLAIGDGANDVNMILSSHVGVGILGREGQQAARSADFAIG